MKTKKQTSTDLLLIMEELEAVKWSLWEMHYDSREFAKKVENLIDIIGLEQEIQEGSPSEEKPIVKRKYTKRHKKWNKKAK